MEVFSVLLVSKNGSLLYHYRVPYDGESKGALFPLKKQTPNDLLVLASNIHGIHAIAAQLTPPNAQLRAGGRQNCNRSGLRMIQCEEYALFVDQMVSGIKIVVFGGPDMLERQALNVSDSIYKAYYDYVLKSPFYTLEMPIRIGSFETAIAEIINKFNYKINNNSV